MKAAMEILYDGTGERPSVRTVAARAGIGASTLRYYFPTQRALMDAVLTAVYDESLPDERIRDTSAPARQRLIDSLWSILDPVASVTEARAVWEGVFSSFIGPTASDESRAGYLVLEREALHRVEAWLAILEAEGTLKPGDNSARARFLLTVVDGLSIERALAASGERIEGERATLAFAVDAVLAEAPRA
ncbi:TetR/AcrR family transcriptional regulator [Microbacterium sp. KCTC 39802]|uniref:TetR/AcrR family transcriptional regulator n=1 Tax=Microbacterium sp. KCTC 39802 TaxID=2183895 RepID=UPI0023B87A6D|nr:TetR/AcrR family transcriptional regulator [Microbacterium sp. KCTC 39802]